MTAFIKENFYSNSGYIDYNLGDTSKFVARLKYVKGAKASFITFLIKNFTVEEYFSRLENREAPLTILESKGYMLPHIKRVLKENGYPQTLAGRARYINDLVARNLER